MVALCVEAKDDSFVTKQSADSGQIFGSSKLWIYLPMANDRLHSSSIDDISIREILLAAIYLPHVDPTWEERSAWYIAEVRRMREP